MKEYEIIRHGRVQGLSLFLDSVHYRTPHFHPEWELLWILKNPMLVNCAGSQLRADEGDFLLFQPGQLHEFHTTSEECLFMCLQVSPDLLRLKQNIALDVTVLNASLMESSIRSLREKLLEIADIYLSGEPFGDLRCTGDVFLMFYALLCELPVHAITQEELMSREKKNQRLESLMRFVDENYMHKIRLSDYAEAEGFSLSYLSHFVKSSLNQSFQEYVNSVRVNCACKLIAAGEEKLTAVCLTSGFSDYRYFSAAFKKQFGMTPEQYKLSVKKPDNAVIHHSIHSLERFFTDEQSCSILAQIRQNGIIDNI